ncbi:YfhD family protein [Paenibacillus sp. FA6]|uniref:YfhD family protein n=1 Tax=Paenibacillus sp. FA6 TaxID=3413029 RepID=UPI003F65D1DA
MTRSKRNNNIITKTGKTTELMSMKEEDVEFSSLDADTEDIEAQVRSKEADERQLQKMKPSM